MSKFARCLKVTLVIDRLCCEWDQLPSKKAFSYKDVLAIHQSASMFLHFVRVLKQTLPPERVRDDHLRDQFLLGGLDRELIVAAETFVPPADVKSVGMFRPGKLSDC